MPSSMNPSEVKSTIESIECSVTKVGSIQGSKQGGAPSVSPTAKSGKAASGSEVEATFEKATSGVPGYGSGNAPKAKQS